MSSPALERAGAAEVAAVRSFLRLEDAADMARRSKRNTPAAASARRWRSCWKTPTRYEEDHTRAEAKSRDQLREAKQAYSLRYDFGYDNDEDAGRYAAERQRYVESELPEYEARVARQRGLAEQELVENFIHRLREQIEDARSQLDHLNATLSKLRFGGERYEFIASPAPTCAASTTW